MSLPSSTATRPGRLALAGRARRLPDWLRAVLIMAGCQLLTGALMAAAARHTMIDKAGHTASWTYLNFGARWDAAWYRRIAEAGYPDTLPLDGHGQVAQNAWAFYPLFPSLAGLLWRAGLGWPLGGWLVAVLATSIAAVLLHRLVAGLPADPHQAADPQLPLWSVALLGSFATAPVLQIPYSEAVGLALLLGVLLALQRGRYRLVIPLLLAVGLARPIAAPLAVVVGVHALLALRQGRLRRPLAAAMVAASGIAVIAWPVIAAVVTGRRSAYTDSMAAWRYGRGVVPFLPWWDGSADLYGPVLGRVALVLVPAGALWWLTRPAASRLLGVDLRVWCVAYAGYLAAILDPTTSLYRYLLLFFPFGVLLAAQLPRRGHRVALVAVGFVTQLVWIVTIWRASGSPP